MTAGFQCVELANRFLWDAYEKGPIFGSNLNGWNFAKTVHADYSSVPLATNGTVRQPYLPGDIVSSQATPVLLSPGLGHVAVVTGSSENSAGNGSVTIMQENATPYSQTLTVSNWSLKMPSGSWVTPYEFDAFTAANGGGTSGNLLRSGSFEGSQSGWSTLGPAGSMTSTWSTTTPATGAGLRG